MIEVGTFISTVGYPIAIGCGLAYIIYKLSLIVINKILIVFDNVIETSKQLTETNRELSSTNALVVTELRGQIKNIDIKLDKIIEKEVG